MTHDLKGNLINVISSEDVQWTSDYPSPYGPLDPGSIEFTPDSLTWQSKRADPTGLIWMGARYYDSRQGCFLSPDPISYPVCLDLYTYANGDPINNFDPDGRYTSPILKDIGMTVADAFFSNRFQGSMRAMGGLTEAVAGGSFALASLETGIGAVAGFAVMAHGLDNFQAGFHQAWNNVSRDPATVQLLQKAGMSHNASHMTNDVGMMLGTMGAIHGARSVATAAVLPYNLPLGNKELEFGNTTIRGFTIHGVNRSIQREIKSQHIYEALKKPLKINEVKIDNLGRPSQRFIGPHAEVVINPKSGKIVSVNPTSTNKFEKLRKLYEDNKTK